MRIMLEEDLARCTTLAEVQDQTQLTLRELTGDGFEIHYVAGPISCDGEDKIPENIAKLLEARTTVMHRLGSKSLVFAAPFIFSLDPNHNSYSRLGLFDMDRNEREAQLQNFWDVLIHSGLIAGIHFVEGSHRSPGANQERATAIEKNVPIFEV